MARSPHVVIASLLLPAVMGGTACSSEEQEPAGGGADTALIEGFHPPAPGANDLRMFAPLVQVEPGADVTWCDYVANPFDREVDVVQSRGYQSKFGHHAILMEVPGSESRLGQSHECTDADMTNARFLAGGSDAAAQFKIPEGVGFRIKPGAVLMVQTHWINTTEKRATGQTIFDISAKEPIPSRQTAQLFAAFTTKVSVPPRGSSKAQASCTIEQDMKLFALGGHAHEWGSNVRLRVSRKNQTTETLYDKPWEPTFQADPPLNYYDIAAPLELHTGDVLTVDCDYKNTTDAEIGFPREMCVGIGFYFPGTADIQCGDGFWHQGNGGAL
ncbi:MAG: hypothetical protein JST00_19430 [Deltaproteobacteria bacterium]|nr:hypothetical protein [Deltaproteobacteria bacterium]